MSAQPLQLPNMSSSQAKLSRVLSCLMTEYDITIAAQPAHISLSVNDYPTEFNYQLTVNINNTPTTIALDNQAASLLLPETLDHQAIAVLPEDLLMASLHNGLDATLQQAAQMFSMPFEVTGLIHQNSQADTEGLIISINTGHTVCSVRVSETGVITALLNLLPKRQMQETLAVPIFAGIELGRSLLPIHSVQNLTKGDVVFLQQHVTGHQVIIRIDPHTAFIAEAEGNLITIQQRVIAMDEEQLNEPEEGLDLNDLTIELLFEIGQQQFTVNDLNGLQPGFVFELDRPIEQPVRIRANGKVIAECQLVQIENRLGAKITHLKKE